MNKHLITALAQHRIFLSKPVEPVPQWLDMRKRMAAEKPFKPKSIKIRYVSDKGGDYWQTPQETQKLKTGDCEDMAIYEYFCRDDRPETAVMFGINRKGVFHSAFIARTPYGGLYVQDNTMVKGFYLGADYLKTFKPTYLISQDKMYVVQPMENDND
jgi:hypothetical protein